MATHAANWARSRGLVRKSEIHGEEEFKVPHKEKFSNVNRESTSQRASASSQLQNAAALLAPTVSVTQHIRGTLGFLPFVLACTPRTVNTANAGFVPPPAGGSKKELVLPLLQQNQIPVRSLP